MAIKTDKEVFCSRDEQRLCYESQSSMNIIMVDDNELSLYQLRTVLCKAVPECNLILFKSPDEALAYIESQSADVAFIATGLPGVGGLGLAVLLQELQPYINIIFVAEEKASAFDAFRLHASGYLSKPVSAADVLNELENLRYPPASVQTKKLNVKCFGDFEVFGPDGIPISFPRTKCKEVLAYLVDRMGSGVTVRQIAAVIWEDRAYDRNIQKQTQTIIAALMKTLKKAGVGKVISKQHNNIAILPDMIECDYYRFLEGDSSARGKYKGEYMCQFSWGENTNGAIWALCK